MPTGSLPGDPSEKRSVPVRRPIRYRSRGSGRLDQRPPKRLPGSRTRAFSEMSRLRCPPHRVRRPLLVSAVPASVGPHGRARKASDGRRPSAVIASPITRSAFSKART